MTKPKAVRDADKLSGKPLRETVEPSSSVLDIDSEGWLTSRDLREDGLSFSPERVRQMSIYLIANPNMSSSFLFRADILFDSQGLLQTPQQKEQALTASGCKIESTNQEGAVPALAIKIGGFRLTRSIIRKLIPRKPEIDRPLEQTCHFYQSTTSSVVPSDENSQRKRFLVMYLPHITSEQDIPFYHPKLRAVAFLYDFQPDLDNGPGTGTMSVHFLPFSDDIPTRLERTLHILLSTNIRLAKHAGSAAAVDGSNHNPTRDNIIPRHIVQNTYSRLKTMYASDLCERWVENTEPSKHVFEDLLITSFLIELWRGMYGVAPAVESGQTQNNSSSFPGFVDVACGNGVLVYVLLMEGYTGWGFDARRRKTWKIFPDWVQERLKEAIYIPKPFLGAVADQDVGATIHSGDFAKDTFIISNHADELTIWTPLMAAHACPESPLPFLSIPCCSHALSGARFRYPPPQGKKQKPSKESKNNTLAGEDDAAEEYVEQNPQPSSGDLKALRAVKDKEQTDLAMLSSQYHSLTAKTMHVAEEIGYEVEKTMLRIPSTRNMGVIGGRQRVTKEWNNKSTGKSSETTADSKRDEETVLQKIREVVERECAKDSGIDAAARIWAERANGLHKGQGKGNQPHY
ncbi:uracil-O(2)--methyltransferase [Penicillium riverlandense]|uniref:uracil-O(2)--methyltransferase n=1 Tax=Penicillium riverlandense TaxID=1903569 RepID=UPI0025484F0C|nr:uracil-O(2)--methyltransferase [Penicillium riverlandense]KAJ5825288.1 uracil-O(2)--methyltransferase [Penicillium riverlandense]